MVADNKYTFEIIGNDKASAMFKKLASNVRNTVNVVGQIGVGAAAGLAVMVQQSARANTEMTRLAESVAVGQQTMGQWAHAAGTVNIEAEKMADIFKDVQDKIGDFATTGGGGAADMFEKLNLDVKDFINLAPDQQLIKIGEALDGVQSESEKIFFLEALAGDASRLLPLLENGAEDLKALSAEADKLGVSLSDLDAAKLELAQRSLEKAQAAAAGFANKVAVEAAPIVEVLVEKLLDVGNAGEGLGAKVKQGFELGAKAAGVFADGLHGVRIIIKGVETLARAMNFVLIGGFVKLIEIIADVSNAIIDGLVFPIRKVLELAAPFNDLAADALVDLDALADRLKVEVPASFQAFADAQAAAFDVARGELHALLMEDLPSNVLKANLDRVLAEVDARVQERVAESRAKLAANVNPEGEVTEDPRAVAERERLAQSIRRLDEQHLTEMQILQVQFAEELLLIQQAEDQKLLTQESANAKRLRANERFELDKTLLVTKSEMARLAISRSLGQLSDAFAQTGSKKAFKVAKALALAQTAVSLPAAVVRSYQELGYPLGIPAAIAMAATGLAQIKQIKSTQFGGSGGAVSATAGGGGSGSGAPSPVRDLKQLGIPDPPSQNEAPGKRVVIQVSGDVVTENIGTWLIEKIRPEIDENDAILIENPNSAQASLLLSGG